MDFLHTWTQDKYREDLSFDIYNTNVKVIFRGQRSKIVKIGNNFLIIEWIIFILGHNISVEKIFHLIYTTLMSSSPLEVKGQKFATLAITPLLVDGFSSYLDMISVEKSFPLIYTSPMSRSQRSKVKNC